MTRAPSPAHFRGRAGLTLVEILVGAAVLLVGFLPVYLFLAGGEREAAETAREVEALALATALLDDLAALPARHLPATPRTDAEEFRALLPPALAKSLSPLHADLAARFERSVEIRAGALARRIAVIVRGKTGDTRREAAEARLEALVYE